MQRPTSPLTLLAPLLVPQFKPPNKVQDYQASEPWFSCCCPSIRQWEASGGTTPSWRRWPVGRGRFPAPCCTGWRYPGAGGLHIGLRLQEFSVKTPVLVGLQEQDEKLLETNWQLGTKSMISWNLFFLVWKGKVVHFSQGPGPDRHAASPLGRTEAVTFREPFSCFMWRCRCEWRLPLQGVFFNWIPPKFSQYNSFYNLWHLEKLWASLHGLLYLKNLGGSS